MSGPEKQASASACSNFERCERYVSIRYRIDVLRNMVELATERETGEELHIDPHAGLEDLPPNEPWTQGYAKVLEIFRNSDVADLSPTLNCLSGPCPAVLFDMYRRPSGEAPQGE